MKKQEKGENKKPKAQVPPDYRNRDGAATSGINTPNIELPAFNPPVPNRAWTAMREHPENFDMLSEKEKRNLSLGN